MIEMLREHALRKFPEQEVEGCGVRQERKMEVDREAKEEVNEEENETRIAKRRCVNSVSTVPFDISSQGEKSAKEMRWTVEVTLG